MLLNIGAPKELLFMWVYMPILPYFLKTKTLKNYLFI